MTDKKIFVDDYCENYGKGCKDCFHPNCFNKCIADAIYNPNYCNRIVKNGKRTFVNVKNEKVGIKRLMSNKDVVELLKTEAQTAFLAKLDLVISQYQKQGCEVEIQYSKDNANFTALVLGRK